MTLEIVCRLKKVTVALWQKTVKSQALGNFVSHNLKIQHKNLLIVYIKTYQVQNEGINFEKIVPAGTFSVIIKN